MDDRFDIGKLVRPNIRALVPYASARDEYTGSASVFLDANENPYNAPLNRYPDPKQQELKEVIAGIREQRVENLFLGNGSDEGIDLLFRVLCEPGIDNIVTIDPTYGMYGVSAVINHVEQKKVLLTPGFQLDADALINAVDQHTKMVFLCSPNNPTSNSLDREAILRIVSEVPCMVVLDEAYIDFSTQESMIGFVPERRNLVVLQTLSKAWGLAGIRLGMVFAHEILIQYLTNVKYPYNINSLTMETAIRRLGQAGEKSRWVSQILVERNVLSGQLMNLSFIEKVYPSDANFLLVKMKRPKAVYNYLMDHGVIVRDRSKAPLCEGCLRITVGTREENRQLMAVLNSYGESIVNL